MTDKKLLEVKHLKKYYYASTGFFKKAPVKVVDDVSLYINEGETLALVGESGCGKSTLGKTILHLVEPTDGEVWFNGELLTEETLPKYLTDMQMIFQDPMSSLNPRMNIFDIIAEPMRVCRTHEGKELEERVYSLMDSVGLRRDIAFRYPHEFSGGQCQRVGIARSLALSPRFFVCDEPVSALDVSVKAQIINMFKDIQDSTGISYLFITHDLLTVRYISHRIAVMYLGHIVETAETEELFSNPLHPYTQALLSAIFVPDVDNQKPRIPVKGEVPSNMNVPSGCPFRTRCPQACSRCAETLPGLKDLGNGHKVSCFLYERGQNT